MFIFVAWSSQYHPANHLCPYLTCVFTSNHFQGQGTCAGLQPKHSMHQNSEETEIIRCIVHAYTHTRTDGLSVGDRYEKGVVLTHWLSWMLQPQRLTGSYLPWADCTAWYSSVIFVGKKRHRGESMMSQKKKKKTANDTNSATCGFYMTMIIHFNVSTVL